MKGGTKGLNEHEVLARAWEEEVLADRGAPSSASEVLHLGGTPSRPQDERKARSNTDVEEK